VSGEISEVHEHHRINGPSCWKGSAKPLKGKKKPSEGKKKPSEGKKKPSEGKKKPSEGKLKPSEGKLKPSERVQMLVKCFQLAQHSTSGGHHACKEDLLPTEDVR
jgi:hypothetical protein